MPSKSLPWLSLLSFPCTVISYLYFYGLPKTDQIYLFFCERGYYQHISVFLFWFGILLLIVKAIQYSRELKAFAMPLPDGAIAPKEAWELAGKMPTEFKYTVLGVRITQLLRGFGRQDELGPLMDRLSEGDRQALERSYAWLEWIRTLPPIVGLLGTLDGLRSGTQDLSSISSAGDVGALRGALQQFALSSSTAFDTTLLGLTAALIISSGSFFLRKKEERFLVQVDRVAETLARGFQQQSRLEIALQQVADVFLHKLQGTLRAIMAEAAGRPLGDHARSFTEERHASREPK
jgi:biopolymer transport protein ExbB/TolQ